MHRAHARLGSVVLILQVAASVFAADGELDLAFSVDGKTRVPFDLGTDATDRGSSLAVDPSGKLVVAGVVDIDDPAHDYAVGVGRILPFGSLDGTFSGDGKFSFVPPDGVDPLFPVAIALAGDGSAFVAGKTENTPLGGGRFVCKISPTGTFDTAFGNLGCLSEDQCALGNVGESRCHYSALVVSGSDLFLAGSFLDFPVGAPSSSDWEFLVEKRSTTDGELVAGFDSDGIVTVPFDLDGESADKAYDLALGHDGTIFVAGSAEDDITLGSTVLAVVALTPAGAVETGFADAGRFALISGEARAIAVDGSGRLVFAGGSLGQEVVVRFLPSGEIDADFGTAGAAIFPGLAGATGATADLVVESGGRPVLALARGDGLFSAARLTEGGALDTTFASDGVADILFDDGPGGDFAASRAIALSGGRVVLTGEAEWNGVDVDFGLARLTATAIFQDGFASGTRGGWSASVP